MSKMRTAQSLSSVQTLQSKKQIRSEAELQSELSALVQQLAMNLADLSEENRTVARSLLNRVSKAADQAEKSIKSSDEKAAERIQLSLQLMKQISRRSSTAATQLETSAKRMKLTALAATWLSGLVIGAALLLALLISQPQLLQAIWNVAQAIR